MIPQFLALALQAASLAPPLTPTPQELSPGVHLIAGSTLPERGPDGNTVIFEARGGLIVVDTGRHDWMSNAVIAFAEARERPVAAIVNTHWHLDHTSGNRRVKARFPSAQLYTTSAIDRVLAPEGFLERGIAGARERLNDSALSPVRREETEIYLATMEASSSLRPDVALTHSARMRIGGRRFDVRVTPGAVTDADVWIYDRRSRTVVLGDLVTLPAPYLDTACPEAWRATLDEVWSLPFTLAIPGHGDPMSRAAFATYRAAYGAYIDCARAETESTQCAANWVRDVSSLLGEDVAYRDRALRVSESYVGYLRENGGKSPDCLSS